MNKLSYWMGVGILGACLGGVAGCGADRSESEGEEGRLGAAQSALVVCGTTCPRGYHSAGFVTVPQCPEPTCGPGGCLAFNAINCEPGE